MVGDALLVLVAQDVGRAYLPSQIKAVDEDASYLAIEIGGGFESDEGDTYLFPMRAVEGVEEADPFVPFNLNEGSCGVED
jgi:hypothetical protein